MSVKDIYVKDVEGKWVVEIKGSLEESAGEKRISVKMQSKEDAIRYARICEQRTGSKVALSSKMTIGE